jgi:hypothetical protein
VPPSRRTAGPAGTSIGAVSLPPSEAHKMARSTSTADPPGPKHTCVGEGTSATAEPAVDASGGGRCARDGHAPRRKKTTREERGTGATVAQVARRGHEALRVFTSMVRALASARLGKRMVSTPSA